MIFDKTIAFFPEEINVKNEMQALIRHDEFIKELLQQDIVTKQGNQVSMQAYLENSFKLPHKPLEEQFSNLVPFIDSSLFIEWIGGNISEKKEKQEPRDIRFVVKTKDLKLANGILNFTADYLVNTLNEIHEKEFKPYYTVLNTYKDSLEYMIFSNKIISTIFNIPALNLSTKDKMKLENFKTLFVDVYEVRKQIIQAKLIQQHFKKEPLYTLKALKTPRLIQSESPQMYIIAGFILGIILGLVKVSWQYIKTNQ